MTLDLVNITLTPPRATEPLFQALSASIAAGEILTIMGPSGAGKSTLLDVIGGHLLDGFHCSGTVSLNGKPLTGLAPEARRIGMLIQEPSLFPHLSVGGNLAFGLREGYRAVRRERIANALASVGLAGFVTRDPATLSGGEKTRVALLRTLLSQPDAVLLDEPFARLDQKTRASVRDLVIAHVKAAGIPAVLVTHDFEDAEAAGGPLIQLKSA
jgi:putative thiamine transport system ATP-binding protein